MALTTEQRALLERMTPQGVRLKLAAYSLGSDDVGFSPTMRLDRNDIERWLIEQGREQETKTLAARHWSVLFGWIGF
jgi:hypothetical protein